MLIETLDRTLWTLDDAQGHVAAQLIAYISADPERLAKAIRPQVHWQPPKDLGPVARDAAWDEIQVALRDGDLHATGRLSTERAASWHSENDGWRYHSGRHSSIAPETTAMTIRTMLSRTKSKALRRRGRKARIIE